MIEFHLKIQPPPPTLSSHPPTPPSDSLVLSKMHTLLIHRNACSAISFDKGAATAANRDIKSFTTIWWCCEGMIQISTNSLSSCLKHSLSNTDYMVILFWYFECGVLLQLGGVVYYSSWSHQEGRRPAFEDWRAHQELLMTSLSLSAESLFLNMAHHYWVWGA